MECILELMCRGHVVKSVRLYLRVWQLQKLEVVDQITKTQKLKTATSQVFRLWRQRRKTERRQRAAEWEQAADRRQKKKQSSHSFLLTSGCWGTTGTAGSDPNIREEQTRRHVRSTRDVYCCQQAAVRAPPPGWKPGWFHSQFTCSRLNHKLVSATL